MTPGPSSRPGAAGAFLPFLRVVTLNALLAYPLLFLIYKHYNPVLTPMDVPGYMEMVEHGPGAVEPPYRYRVLAPLAVRAMRVLPGYGIPVTYSSDPAAQADFFHFLLLDFVLSAATSGLVFLYLRDKVKPAFAYLGSLLYLLSFYTVVTNIIPMTDASCHLALMVCILLMERNRPLWFALACLIGVFTKETLLVVLFPWIAARAWRDRSRLRYFALALPAAAAYFAVTRLFPSPSPFDYYRPGFLLGNLLRAFNPLSYDLHMASHIFLAHVPLLAALAAYAWLRRKGREDIAFPPELAVFPFLIWLGMTMGLGNNTGRVAFMAFPALMLFEARVLQALAGGDAPEA